MAESDRYFPASLAKAYFNWCAAHDHSQDTGLFDFIAEVQGNKHLNGIPSHRTIEEIFDYVSRQTKLIDDLNHHVQIIRDATADDLKQMSLHKAGKAAAKAFSLS